MRRKTNEEFLEELKINNPSICALEDYINGTTKIKVKCKKCNYTWTTTPNSLIHGHGCPKCANNIRKSTNQFKAEMNEFNPYIEILGEYKNALKPILVKCKVCGNQWEAKPNRLLRGAQCMNCVKPHTSFMEQFIIIALQTILGEINVLSRDRDVIGMELDIYLPKYKVAIEPGTWLYHEKKAKEMDSIKREKCFQKGIRIITIYDTYPKGQNPPFDRDCYVFEGFLNEKGFERLIGMTDLIIKELGINEYELDWNEIAHRAYEACHYNAHESFAEKLKKVSPNIVVIDKYKGTKIPLLVNSLSCNHSPWRASPESLLNGHGCPVCGRKLAAKKHTRSNERFVDEMKHISPNIEVVGKYKKVTDGVEVKCKKCGHQWSPVAYSLLSGKGCPHCSALEGARKRKNGLAVKNTSQFKKELKDINKEIIVLGEYVNNKTKIQVKCKKCGHKWDVVPGSLLNGHGCPKCARLHK